MTDEEYVEAVLRHMADHLFADVRAEGRTVRTLTVKVRYNDRDENHGPVKPAGADGLGNGYLRTVARDVAGRLATAGEPADGIVEIIECLR